MEAPVPKRFQAIVHIPRRERRDLSCWRLCSPGWIARWLLRFSAGPCRGARRCLDLSSNMAPHRIRRWQMHKASHRRDSQVPVSKRSQDSCVFQGVRPKRSGAHPDVLQHVIACARDACARIQSKPAHDRHFFLPRHAWGSLHVYGLENRNNSSSLCISYIIYHKSYIYIYIIFGIIIVVIIIIILRGVCVMSHPPSPLSTKEMSWGHREGHSSFHMCRFCLFVCFCWFLLVFVCLFVGWLVGLFVCLFVCFFIY